MSKQHPSLSPSAIKGRREKTSVEGNWLDGGEALNVSAGSGRVSRSVVRSTVPGAP